MQTVRLVYAVDEAGGAAADIGDVYLMDSGFRAVVADAGDVSDERDATGVDIAVEPDVAVPDIDTPIWRIRVWGPVGRPI